MKASLLDWLLDRLGVVIFVVIFVVQIIRGLLQAARRVVDDTIAANRREDGMIHVIEKVVDDCPFV